MGTTNMPGGRGRLAHWERWAEGRSVGGAIALGVGAGAGWGIVARAWMRVISDQPEFSWSGTLYVVAAPAAIGALVALAHVAMARHWRGAVLVRVPAVVVHVLLGVGAGMALLPTIVFGGIAVARRRFGWGLRAGLALLVLAVGLPVGAMDAGSPVATAAMGLGLTVAALLLWDWRTRLVLAVLGTLPALAVSAGVLTSDIPLLRALPGALAYLPLVAIPTLSVASVLRPRPQPSVIAGATGADPVTAAVLPRPEIVQGSH